MASEPNEFISDLLRALSEHPEARREIARLLLDEQISAFRAESEDAFRRTDAHLARIDAHLARIDEILAELAQAQAQTERRLEALIQQVGALTEAQLLTEQTLQVMQMQLGAIRGRDLERAYRDKASAYFGKIARRIRVLTSVQIDDILEEAVEQAKLTIDEANDVRLTDVIASARLLTDLTEVRLLVEVSATVNSDDVERAVRRAERLTRTGIPAVPIVAGEHAPGPVVSEARASGVWVVTDGQTQAPDAAATG